MAYILLGFSAIIIVVALSYFSNFDKKRKNSNNENNQHNAQNNFNHNENNQNQNSFVTCPLCNSPLLKGQNLVSKVYRPMNVPDQRCTINGCPHCYPVLENGKKRVCPCCKKEVPMNGYLIARLFNYRNNKKHVRVTGCSRCLD